MLAEPNEEVSELQILLILSEEMKLTFDSSSLGRVWYFPNNSVAIRRTHADHWYEFKVCPDKPYNFSVRHESEVEAMKSLHRQFKDITEKWWERL